VAPQQDPQQPVPQLKPQPAKLLTEPASKLQKQAPALVPQVKPVKQQAASIKPQLQAPVPRVKPQQPVQEQIKEQTHAPAATPAPAQVRTYTRDNLACAEKGP